LRKIFGRTEAVPIFLAPRRMQAFGAHLGSDSFTVQQAGLVFS
jgi:hypothetical protein